MGQFDATKGKQALEIRSSLSERRALTDPILPGDSADLAHAHSRQWAKAHGEFKTLFAILNICLHLLLLYREVPVCLKVDSLTLYTSDTCWLPRATTLLLELGTRL